MPITNHIHWDERLEAFKGHDTTDYVLNAASGVAHCADCEKPLGADDELSLIVDIQQDSDFARSGTRRFDSYICHRTCQTPDLTLRNLES